MIAERGLVPLEVRTISERLVEIVREMILSGAISSDEPIRQDSLAAQLNVSKIPLREALVRLEQDGLVRSQANRGYVVRMLSAEEAEEVYALRLKLEPDAVAEACLKATENDQKAAKLALARLDAAASSKQPDVGALNRAFHLALVRPCGKQLTTDLVLRLHVMADRYVCKHLEPQGRHIRAEAEHQEILKAWLKRDADKARALVREHLEHTLLDLRKEIGAANDAEAPAPDRRRKQAPRKAAPAAAGSAVKRKAGGRKQGRR